MIATNWVVIPCYNEEQKISGVIEEVLEYCSNIIVVDDGSRDNTYDIASTKCRHVLRHMVNLGKGAALKTGVEYAIELGAKKIVFIDGDGQHEPKELPRYFKLLDEYDIVFGSRQLNKQMPLVFRCGNALLTYLIDSLFHIRVSDSQSGYRGIRAEIYPKIKWNATDYSVETEIIANVGKHRLRYHEIQISTIYHNRYKGTTVLDGIKIAIQILLLKLQR